MKGSQKEILPIFYLPTYILAFMGITTRSVKSLNISNYFVVIINVLPTNVNT